MQLFQKVDTSGNLLMAPLFFLIFFFFFTERCNVTNTAIKTVLNQWHEYVLLPFESQNIFILTVFFL